MKIIIVLCALIVNVIAVSPPSTNIEPPSLGRSFIPNPLPKKVRSSNNLLSNSFGGIKEDGSYGWKYETPEGISVSESGVGGKYAKGNVAWISPEGERVTLQYTADENGYQPSGSHVPQVPEYITKALEWIRSHPSAN